MSTTEQESARHRAWAMAAVEEREGDPVRGVVLVPSEAPPESGQEDNEAIVQDVRARVVKLGGCGRIYIDGFGERVICICSAPCEKHENTQDAPPPAVPGEPSPSVEGSKRSRAQGHGVAPGSTKDRAGAENPDSAGGTPPFATAIEAADWLEYQAEDPSPWEPEWIAWARQAAQEIRALAAPASGAATTDDADRETIEWAYATLNEAVAKHPNAHAADFIYVITQVMKRARASIGAATEREAVESVLYSAFEAGWFDNTGDLGTAWSERKPELLNELRAALRAPTPGPLPISGGDPAGEVPSLPNAVVNDVLMWIDNDGNELADDAIVKLTSATGRPFTHVTAGWLKRFITATNGTRFGTCEACGRMHGDHTPAEQDACAAVARATPGPEAGERVGWQPISTAPKDGTVILGAWRYGSGYDVSGVSFKPNQPSPEHMPCEWNSWFDVSGEECNPPTHWMPLPPPPSTGDDGR